MSRANINNFMTWDNEVYSEFMKNVLNNLEPRIFEAGKFIYGQWQPVVEQVFLTDGKVEVGVLSKQN